MRKEELIQKLDDIGKEFFSIKDLEKIFPLDAHIKTHIKRFKDSGLILPITKGVYTFSSHPIDLERIATQIYYPSYISFESALSKYGIMNQGLNKLTLATTRHSKKMALMGIECEYCKLKQALYFGFSLMGGIYIAEPEKAILDTLYLVSLSKRSIDYSEWYLEEVNKKKIQQYAKKYNPKVREILGKMI